MTVSAATTLGRVPPRTTPAFTVTPGQRPFSACSAMILWAASSTALRPFSGSTPACAARPVMRSSKSAMPLRELTMSPLARAPSRTSATSTVAACAWMTGVLTGEPISSSGLATNTMRPNGSGPNARSTRSAYNPARRPPFMSETPGPVATPSLIANGRSATVPGSNTVSRWPTMSSAGPAASRLPRVPTTVSPWSVFAVISTLAPRSPNALATQRPTSSTPTLVYEPQSMSTSRWRSAR